MSPKKTNKTNSKVVEILGMAVLIAIISALVTGVMNKLTGNSFWGTFLMCWWVSMGAYLITTSIVGLRRSR